MSFLAVDEEFLEGTLKFENNEIVRMKCIDVTENKEYKFIGVKSMILTGPNEGKEYTVTVREKPAPLRRQFLLEFWSPEQLMNKEARLSDLISKTFEVKAKYNEYQNKTYLNWEGFKKVTASLEELNG